MFCSGEHHLGFNDSDLYGKSWYELLHPEDMMEAKEKHIQCEYQFHIDVNCHTQLAYHVSLCVFHPIKFMKKSRPIVFHKQQKLIPGITSELFT